MGVFRTQKHPNWPFLGPEFLSKLLILFKKLGSDPACPTRAF